MQKAQSNPKRNGRKSRRRSKRTAKNSAIPALSMTKLVRFFIWYELYRQKKGSNEPRLEVLAEAFGRRRKWRRTKIAKIKKDLRRLRKITHSVEVALQVKERHERRLSYLEREKPSKENIEEAQKIRKNLASLRIDDIIKEATTLESLYGSDKQVRASR